MARAASTKPKKKASKPRLAAAGVKPAGRARGAARLELPAECTVRDAPALQAMLIATVSPTDSVLVDGSAVTRIDAAALQLLVALARREAAAGRRIDWQNPSSDLIESSAQLGLAAVLGLPARAGVPA